MHTPLNQEVMGSNPVAVSRSFCSIFIFSINSSGVLVDKERIYKMPLVYFDCIYEFIYSNSVGVLSQSTYCHEHSAYLSCLCQECGLQR